MGHHGARRSVLVAGQCLALSGVNWWRVGVDALGWEAIKILVLKVGVLECSAALQQCELSFETVLRTQIKVYDVDHSS